MEKLCWGGHGEWYLNLVSHYLASTELECAHSILWARTFHEVHSQRRLQCCIYWEATFAELLHFDVITVSAEGCNYPFNKQSTTYLIFEVLSFEN